MDSIELSILLFQPFYIQVAAITLYYYDFFLTFAAEVSHIWPQPISRNTFLFFCNRYISFVGNIAGSILLFGHLSTSTDVSYQSDSCSNLVRIREILMVLGQVAVAATLATRTVALYGRSRTIRLSVIGFGALLVGVTCWALVTGEHGTANYIVGAPGCRYFMPEETAIHLAAAWEASALFDIFIFILTLMKTLKIRKLHNTASSSLFGLLDLILRDGALYFFVMALANSANILTFYFATAPFKGTFTTPASCIASTLCSRLVLNLYDAAPLDGTTDSDSFHDSMTNCILTTRIELGLSMDHDDRSEVKSSWE